MRIFLLSTKDEPEKMNKSVTQLATVSGYARDMDQIGTEKTEFLIETDNAELVNSCNYMYVEDLNKYYFVGDKKAKVNKLWLFPGFVDPLMSFKGQIANCEGILERSATKGDYYIQDPKDVCYQNPHIVYKVFRDGEGSQPKFDGLSVILTTC